MVFEYKPVVVESIKLPLGTFIGLLAVTGAKVNQEECCWQLQMRESFTETLWLCREGAVLRFHGNISRPVDVIRLAVNILRAAEKPSVTEQPPRLTLLEMRDEFKHVFL